MLVYGSSQDAVIRYNISQNDGLKGKHILDFPSWVSPRGSGIIHNNVFYIGEEIGAVLIDEALSTAKFYNNIVINRGTGALVVRSEGQTAEFSNNSLSGYPAAETSINQYPVEGDPALTDPGNGGMEISSLDGYKLMSGSPCLHAGISPAQMNGNYWLNDEMTDLWGNSVNAEKPDVGAHQLSGPSAIGPGAESDHKVISWNILPVPFSGRFCVSMDLQFPTEVRIKMFDMSGKYIDTLYSGKLNVGANSLYFDMMDSLYAVIPPGLYVLQLTAPILSIEESRIVIRN